jgi:hypothetical protein
MSNLLSTAAMVVKCQARVPLGLSSAFWMDKLNEAYRWVSQKGNYVWDLTGATITVGAFQSGFPIPSGCDPGKPMYLSGPLSVTVPAERLNSSIPYVPWDSAQLQQMSEMPVIPGMISCWTVRTNVVIGPPLVYGYRGYLYPEGAISSGSQFEFIYHTDVSGTEFASGASVYFPTPNSFDNLFVELAEAEAKRIYGLAGWDIIQKRAESAIVNLLDSYRSTKNVLAGLTDQQKQVSEKKMMAQENA